MRLAISGKSGCGNTTISATLAKRLDYHLVNYTFRNLAEEMRVPMNEIQIRAKYDSTIDEALDQKQIKMALEHENCVLASRLAIWMLKDADIKIWIDTPDEIRFKRISERENKDLDIVRVETIERDDDNETRYAMLYDIDVSKASEVADYVVDGTKTPGEICDFIIAKLIDRGKTVRETEDGLPG
jgi:cytidylate kinase